MTDFDSAMRPWKALMDSLQPYTGIRRAFIGNGAGTVDVDSMPGWSWIRYDESQSKLSMVRNPAFGLLPDGVPVIVGKRHHTDDYEQILYVDFAYWYDMSDAERIQYRVPPHGISHGGAIGSDPAPIDLNNISYGKVVPTDPASLSVLIYPFIYSNSLSVILYAGETLDLTASVPVGAGHRYVLVYLDQSTGAAGFVNGTVVGIPAPAIPVPDAIAGTYPLAIVELTNGQATILISDIAQWKLPWCVVGGTIGPHTHSDDSSGGTSIIGLEEFMFACHTPLFLVGAHVWPTEVYHELYIPTMYDGLNLEADLIWIHPDPVDGCGQILILKVADPGLYSTYQVNVRHGIGNIWLSGGDVVLDEGTDHLWLIYNGEYWCNDVGRIAAGVTGSGVDQQVAYWTGATTIDGDAQFTYDPATDTITLAGTIVLTPSGVGDADIITITPSAALTTIGAEWRSLTIDGAALDPSAVDVEIHGVHFDFSGVDVTNQPHIDGVHIETPPTYHEHGHGIHLDGLGIRIDHDDTTAVAGQTHTIIDVVINEAGSTGGETHALDVARTGGGSVDVTAVGTHTGVDPIHQHVGAFAGSAKAWRYVAIGPAWTDATAEFDGGVNLQIFAADNDVIYVSGTADDATFDEIEVMLAVAASKDIHAVFEYSVAGPGWTVFNPADDTDGFQDNGIIRFEADDLAGWARIDVNAEGTNRYWIRITRTRNNVPTPPTEATIRVLAPTEYSWDELGNLSILGIIAGADIDPSGASGQDLGDATHRWDLYTQEVIFGGASGANVITVPDNLADALHIIDDGDANDYLTFVTANAQREVVFNQDGADIDTRIEAAGGITNALFVRGSDGLVGFGRVPTAQVDIAAAAAAGWTLQTSFDNSGNCWRMWRAGLFSATMAQIAGTAFNLANNASYITGAWAFDGLDTKSALKMVLDAWSGNFLFDIAPANPAGAPVFDTKVVFKNTGDVGIGVAVGAIAAKLHVDQSSASGAQPVLLLDQADVSEEMIEFVCTIGVGNAIEAAGGKTLTATHFIKVTLPGPLTRYIPVGTIA